MVAKISHQIYLFSYTTFCKNIKNKRILGGSKNFQSGQEQSILVLLEQPGFQIY